jgi:hypothetical protein
MIHTLHVAVLGDDTTFVDETRGRLERLGCRASGSAGAAVPQAEAGLLVLDLRGADGCPRELADAVGRDARPLMLVSDRLTPEVRVLARRSGPVMLMTGAESDGGFRVALSVLSGLRARSPRSGASRPSATSTPAALRAHAAGL